MKDRYFGCRGGWLTFWITVACGTDMTLFGYDQGVFGGVIVTDDFLDTLGIRKKTGLQGTIVAIYDIGCFFGAILAYFIGDRLGRKKSVLLGTTILSIGAILQITTYSVGQIIAGRVIAGIGNGLNTSTAPPWQAETSKASWRGKLIVIELILNIAGFSLSNWVTFGFSYVPGPVAWRLPLAMQFIFIFILFGTVPWLPESPRWLVKKGPDRYKEAEQILADCEGTEIEDPYVQTELEEIKFADAYEREHAVRIRDLVRGRVSEQDPCTLRRILLGMGAQAMQQLSGINVTSYYLPTVLIQSVGFGNRMARLLAACNSVSYLLFSTIGIPNVERWGRRKMIMYAAAGQCFCYLMITILLSLSEQYDNSHSSFTRHQLQHMPGGKLATASVAFFFLYYIFFGIGFQGVPWLYPTEINGLAMRAKGAALGTATNWIFNFMVPNTSNTVMGCYCQLIDLKVVEITQIGIQSLHWKFYIIWTILNGSFVPFTYFLYPETAGRTLEDIDSYFRDHPSILVFRDHKATSSKRPQEYIDKEETEVHRRSSVDPRAMSLAQQHRRFSVMSEQNRMSSVVDEKDIGEHKENV